VKQLRRRETETMIESVENMDLGGKGAYKRGVTALVLRGTVTASAGFLAAADPAGALTFVAGALLTKPLTAGTARDLASALLCGVGVFGILWGGLFLVAASFGTCEAKRALTVLSAVAALALAAVTAMAGDATDWEQRAICGLPLIALALTDLFAFLYSGARLVRVNSRTMLAFHGGATQSSEEPGMTVKRINSHTELRTLTKRAGKGDEREDRAPSF